MNKEELKRLKEIDKMLNELIEKYGGREYSFNGRTLKIVKREYPSKMAPTYSYQKIELKEEEE